MPLSPRRCQALFLFALAFVSGAQAADEPPIIAFQALVSDSAGVTRRWQTYPLAAALPRGYIDLADQPSVEALLTSHPGLTFTEISPKGQLCASIPVGLGVKGNSPSDLLPSALPAVDVQREFTLVVFASSTQISMLTKGEGIPRILPADDQPGRPSTDPLESLRRTVTDRLGGRPENVALEKHGAFDFDGDRVPEDVYLGYVTPLGRTAQNQGVLMVVKPGVLALPIYIYEMAAGTVLMGVGDVNGDGRAEMILKTGQAPRDFGLEIHAWRGGAVQRVFEHRSYGCY